MSAARIDAAHSLLAAEPLVRIGVFAGALALLAIWEMVAPRRERAQTRWRRWPGNLGIVLINSLLLRIIFPTALVGFAVVAHANGWGLFNRILLPGGIAILLTVVLLDLTIYAQHVLFHAVPWAWRLHRMHHADLDIDVTTGVRFHPGEILLSMVLKFAAVAVLGAPALGVMIFEILLNATAMFSHSNVRLSARTDRHLRRMIVTPDMHRVHHSIVAAETNSNFGFNLPWWDWLFGTYRAQPAAGHEGMTVGLAVFRDPVELGLARMLIQPLRLDQIQGEA